MVPRPITYLGATGLVLVVTVAFLVLGLGGMALKGDVLDPWSLCLIHLIAFGTAVWIGVLRAGPVGPHDLLRLHRFSPVAFFGLLTLALGASVVFAEVDNWMLELWPLSADELAAQARWLDPESASDRAGILVLMGVVTPAAEETLFRGLLLERLSVAYGRRLASLFSAAAFALLVAILYMSPRSLPQLLVLGLALGWIVHRTGSLLAAIVAHGLFNAAPHILTAHLLRVPGWNAVEQVAGGGPDHVRPGLVLVASALCLVGGTVVARLAPQRIRR